ncbi:K+-dependent Na+/Ca+ exchanger related-protein [Rhodopirellula maiorica SM1]|uniref:K+-dependent Na+/Ca+ exchanger related-protein n=1 Tax=Rhodopirellula maiorica SM1 TaxID=1265738 RepID=M5RB85_9BACT|nr:calcium/sodium antiporter [Rhodopirellula maiorica]EMI16748.1 K+-dependent Na+/Ca+ exchanger related-protein [Rhodopirellula maiorica SM1]
MTYVLLLLGLAILVLGAELLVRGAVTLAEAARISPLVIGLTVVAFGTSAPELAVSSVSSLKGDAAIALGNVVGSNIFNVLLILGVSAVIVPLSVSSQLVRFDVPIMIAASVVVWLAASDGTVQRWEGGGMLVAFLLYTGWLIRAGRKEPQPNDSQTDFAVPPVSWRKWIGNLVMLLIGLGLLVVGADLLVDSATVIARQFGVNDLVIGLTIVAAGTSLPELATSIVAAIRGQRDIAVGNIVGSNVFNLLMVLATAAVVAADGVPVANSVLWFDLAVMLGVAVLCWPIFLSHAVVSRAEGIVMLLLYLFYNGLLIGGVMQSQWVSTAKNYLVFAAMPLVLVAVSYIAWKQHRRESPRDVT